MIRKQLLWLLAISAINLDKNKAEYKSKISQTIALFEIINTN